MKDSIAPAADASYWILATLIFALLVLTRPTSEIANHPHATRSGLQALLAECGGIAVMYAAALSRRTGSAH